MRRRTVSIALVGTLVLVGGALLWTGMAKAQPAPRPAEQASFWVQRMANSDVSALWMQLCFEIKVSNEQLTKLRPTFQKEWDKRKEMAEGVTGQEDFQALRPKIQEARTAFIEVVKKELTEEQQKALAGWSEQAGRFGGGRPGGPGRREGR